MPSKVFLNDKGFEREMAKQKKTPNVKGFGTGLGQPITCRHVFQFHQSHVKEFMGLSLFGLFGLFGFLHQELHSVFQHLGAILVQQVGGGYFKLVCVSVCVWFHGVLNITKTNVYLFEFVKQNKNKINVFFFPNKQTSLHITVMTYTPKVHLVVTLTFLTLFVVFAFVLYAPRQVKNNCILAVCVTWMKTNYLQAEFDLIGKCIRCIHNSPSQSNEDLNQSLSPESQEMCYGAVEMNCV